MDDRKLTERESLELITSMISRTKARYLGSGNILSMWGYLIVFVSLLVWILLSVTRQSACNWLWFAIPLIGFPTMTIMARREKRYSGVTTYSDKITSRLWTIFGISEIVLTCVCLGFSVLGSVDCWSAMLVYTLLIAPVAEIAQGLIVREKSLIIGAMVGLAVGMITVCCIAGGVKLYACWFMPLFILAFVAMMIIPGHILRNKEKQQ